MRFPSSSTGLLLLQFEHSDHVVKVVDSVSVVSHLFAKWLVYTTLPLKFHVKNDLRELRLLFQKSLAFIRLTPTATEERECAFNSALAVARTKTKLRLFSTSKKTLWITERITESIFLQRYSALYDLLCLCTTKELLLHLELSFGL